MYLFFSFGRGGGLGVYIETSWGRGEEGGGEEEGEGEREKNSSQSSTFPKRNTCPKTHISSLPTFVEAYFLLLHFHQPHSTTIPPKSSPKQSPNKDTISTIENIFSLMTFTLSAFLFFSFLLANTNTNTKKKEKKKNHTRAQQNRDISPLFPFPLQPTGVDDGRDLFAYPKPILPLI